ncbi:hypothetical protein ABZS66_28040 [Dactylosporangium sp. NPDC005572]|uniref:hypothetical protein n=1 Tax=Dactylosporangium sp. NPDC005572 TaxID=3156889 RepID=UPI0033B19C81
MNRQLPNDPGKGTRLLADRAEQTAQDFSRIAAAVVVIVDGVKLIHKAVSPLVAELRRPLTSPPAKIQVLVPTKRV